MSREDEGHFSGRPEKESIFYSLKKQKAELSEGSASAAAELDFKDVVSEKAMQRRFKYFAFFFAMFAAAIFLTFSLYLICKFIGFVTTDAKLADLHQSVEVLVEQDKMVKAINPAKAVVEVPGEITESPSRHLTSERAIPYLAGFVFLLASIGLTVVIATLRYAFHNDQDTKVSAPAVPLASAVADLISEIVSLLKK